MHVFFWCWIFFTSLFSPALPLQMPGRAAKVNLLFCPMQHHPGFCSMLSSLLLWAYLEMVFKVDVFRASEISLPASSQHKWNYIVKKYCFFIGDCIRIWALHRVISTESNFSSWSVFALSSDTVVYFVSRTLWIPVGLMWLARSGILSPPLTSGWALPEFHLTCKTRTEVNTLMRGNILVGCREQRDLHF